MSEPTPIKLSSSVFCKKLIMRIRNTQMHRAHSLFIVHVMPQYSCNCGTFFGGIFVSLTSNLRQRTKNMERHPPTEIVNSHTKSAPCTLTLHTRTHTISHSQMQTTERKIQNFILPPLPVTHSLTHFLSLTCLLFIECQQRQK